MDEEEGRREGEDIDFDIENIHWSCQWSVLIVCPWAVAFVGLRMRPFQNREYCIYFEISRDSDDNGIQRYLKNSIILSLS